MVKGLDTADVLAKLAAIRAQMPKPSKPRPKRDESSRTKRAMGGSIEDFEDAALIDALEDMSEELGAALAEKREKMIAQALEVYYTAEELAKDPAHSELIPHLEKMRTAYEHDFGKPIPPRKK
jgi:hypothetical protein